MRDHRMDWAEFADQTAGSWYAHLLSRHRYSLDLYDAQVLGLLNTVTRHTALSRTALAATLKTYGTVLQWDALAATKRYRDPWGALLNAPEKREGTKPPEVEPGSLSRLLRPHLVTLVQAMARTTPLRDVECVEFVDGGEPLPPPAPHLRPGTAGAARRARAVSALDGCSALPAPLVFHGLPPPSLPEAWASRAALSSPPHPTTCVSPVQPVCHATLAWALRVSRDLPLRQAASARNEGQHRPHPSLAPPPPLRSSADRPCVSLCTLLCYKDELVTNATHLQPRQDPPKPAELVLPALCAMDHV